jgi:4-hydroxybenzoate polyprenyltransferase
MRTPSPMRRLLGLIRLTHPFPIMLDGLATTGIALVAGAEPGTAARLGLAMIALQASIGALNDVVDAPADARSKPAKPIPSGYVSAREGTAVVVAAAVVGIVLAMASGPATTIVAVLILGIGYVYDLRAKGTAWSWLPFAVGIPMLPVFAWLGVRGDLPEAFVVLIPAAVVAGAGLAVANAGADLERDEAAGRGSVAIRLGLERAWLVSAALLGGATVLAFGTLVVRQPPNVAWLAVAGAGAVVLIGVGLGRRGSAVRRERAWEVQAIGTALLAAAWLASWGGLA